MYYTQCSCQMKFNIWKINCFQTSFPIQRLKHYYSDLSLVFNITNTRFEEYRWIWDQGFHSQVLLNVSPEIFQDSCTLQNHLVWSLANSL